MIRLERIVKTFEHRLILDHIDLQLEKGKIHGIIGDNGAGKTVLVNILSGVYQPDQGTITIDGKPVRFSSPKDAIRAGIAAIHQETQIVGKLTVAENIIMGDRSGISRSTWFVSWKNMITESERILNQIHYPLDPHRLAETLNLGQQQILKVARAICSSPQVLIMDEPFTNLSEQEIKTFKEIISSMQSSGITIIYISHDTDDILRRCDTLTVLRDGQVIHSGPNSFLGSIPPIRELLPIQDAFKYPRVPTRPGRKILEITNLKTGRGVHDASLFLRKGEILGITGTLGSGKTGIIKALLGLERILQGTILLDGEPFTPKDPHHAFSHRIGYLPEDIRKDWLHEDMPFSHNLTMSNLHELHGRMALHPELEAEAARRYITSLKIKVSRLDEHISQLSGGNKQKVAIAKLLFTDSRILILDEPTKYLDSSTRIDVYNLMSKCAGEGMAIIFISTDERELKGMCDRILVMKKGTCHDFFHRKETGRSFPLDLYTAPGEEPMGQSLNSPTRGSTPQRMESE